MDVLLFHLSKSEISPFPLNFWNLSLSSDILCFALRQIINIAIYVGAEYLLFQGTRVEYDSYLYGIIIIYRAKAVPKDCYCYSIISLLPDLFKFAIDQNLCLSKPQ